VFTIILFTQFSNAQITGPVTRANFGVEAELRANYFNGVITSVGDDWFNNGTGGTGQFIIDTTGAAAIVAAYTTNPASRMWPFSRVMRQAPYTIVNNRLLIDAIFNRDFHGDDSTVFAAGSNKNGDSPASWSCPVSQGIPDKNDILDGMIHARRAGPNITDSLWIFGGVSIENTVGNRYFDFELYQTDLYYDRPARVFRNYGPDMGHTAWVFNADGSVRTPGDIIFTAEYSSSALTLVEARIWIAQTSLAITPMFWNWGGLYDGAFMGAPYGYANILPKTAGIFYTGLQSPNGVWGGPFSIVHQDNSLATTYTARAFMEFSVNMTKLGLDPAYISSNGCGTPFRRVLIKSRASTSFTAELKDFVAPFRMFNYPYPQAVAELPIFCGQMGVTDITIANPMTSSTYTWSTPDGNIVGSTTGPSITVDTTGTYLVTQYLHLQCPAYAYDTVTVSLDTNCLILDKNLAEFNAVLNNRNTALRWNVYQNERISGYAIEYSTENNNFTLLENITPTEEIGSESYLLNHDISNIYAPVIYYRLRLTGWDGKTVYSNIMAVRLSKDIKTGLLIYPNPSAELVWASIVAAKTGEAEYSILDVNSRLINRKKLVLYAGNNTINLSELDNRQPGVYFIKMVLDGQSLTRKIVITK
jgi:hypothetical protein